MAVGVTRAHMTVAMHRSEAGIGIWRMLEARNRREANGTRAAKGMAVTAAVLSGGHQSGDRSCSPGAARWGALGNVMYVVRIGTGGI